MTAKSSVFMFFFGLLLTFGAVGGMEDPTKINYLVEQLACALVGLGLMFCGTLGFKNSPYYD